MSGVLQGQTKLKVISFQLELFERAQILLVHERVRIYLEQNTHCMCQAPGLSMCNVIWLPDSPVCLSQFICV